MYHLHLLEPLCSGGRLEAVIQLSRMLCSGEGVGTDRRAMRRLLVLHEVGVKLVGSPEQAAVDTIAPGQRWRKAMTLQRSCYRTWKTTILGIGDHFEEERCIRRPPRLVLQENSYSLELVNEIVMNAAAANSSHFVAV